MDNCQMYLEAMLPALKIDLAITADIYDERLLSRLRIAVERIGNMGITLGGSEADRDLVLMYAAWLWRSRVTQAPMGRMLQQALNNRLFGQTAKGAAE